MTKLMRKYKAWLMVVFGILLMLAFLGGPAINELTQMQRNRVIGKIDGEPIRAGEWASAVGEASAFHDLARQGLAYFDVGMEESDPHHWLLLTREAQAAGLVAEPANGEQYLDAMVPMMAQQVLQAQFQQDIQRYIEYLQADAAKKQAMLDQTSALVMRAVQQNLASAHLNQQDAGRAVARLMGVHQLQSQYLTAPRVSSRRALVEANKNLDSVTGDALVIPASKIADQVPAPTPEELEAHFNKYKSVKPGEGEYGVGYFLPPRVRLEYLRLNREKIENAVTLDPVEVRKKYAQERAAYPGEFAAERPNVEAALRREEGQKLLREAHSALQREVQKVTRRLESSGRFKLLPPEWEQARPQFGAVAQAVVDSVRASTGVTIPAPEVVTKNEGWLTQQELAGLEGIGRSEFRQGGLQIPFPMVVFWARELGGSGPIPVQEDFPVVDTPLHDNEGNLYFFTLLATRPESAPDSVTEIAEKAAEDYRNILAFEQLKGRTSELAATASAGGLAELVEQYALRPAPAAEGAPPSPEPIRSDLRLSRQAGGAVPALQDPSVRDAIMDAAESIDPLLPPEQIPPAAATVAVASPKELSVVIYRITRVQPLTVEMVRNAQADTRITNQIILDQMRERAREAFSLANLLKRHTYYNGKERIETPEQLKSDEG